MGTLLDQVMAVIVGAIVVAAAGLLAVAALRAEQRTAAAWQVDRALAESAALVEGLVDRRTPGRAARPLADGVALRVRVGDGTACGRAADGALLLRHEQLIRLPITGDLLLAADSLAPDGWREHPILSARTAACPDGAPAQALRFSAADTAVHGPGLVIADWLEIAFSSAAPVALAVRPLGAASGRQPASGPLDPAAGGVRIVLLDQAEQPLAPGDSASPATLLLQLAASAPRSPRRALERRLPLGPGAW